MFGQQSSTKGNRAAAIALMALLYGQGLLGFAAVAAVLVKERVAEQPPVVASIVPIQPAS